jgi:hypothetical protein
MKNPNARFNALHPEAEAESAILRAALRSRIMQTDTFLKQFGMTTQERLCLQKLKDFWCFYNHLPIEQPDELVKDDLDSVRKAVHDIQAILAVRVARRVDPQIWS